MIKNMSSVFEKMFKRSFKIILLKVKWVYVNRISTWDTKAHDLYKCSVNDGLKGSQGTGNGKSRPKRHT